jgi:hypothetical protein
MIATEYKDNDKKLKGDQLLTKINAIPSLSTSSSSVLGKNVLREGDNDAAEESVDSIHEGRKRKMTVTVVKSSTTLAHSEYISQQQLQQKKLLSSASQSPIFPQYPGPSLLSLSVPTNNSASSGGDSVVTTDDVDTTYDGDSTPCFPPQGTPHATGMLYQNPLNHSTSSYQFNSTQQAQYSSFYSASNPRGTAADTPEFPSLPATPCIEPNAHDTANKKPRI